MIAHATVADLETRMGERVDGIRASALLRDASAIIDAAVGSGSPGEDVLRSVCCAMVARALMAGGSVSQQSESVGPFSRSVTFANPTGDLYLLDSERRALGVKRQRVGCIMPTYGAGDECLTGAW